MQIILRSVAVKMYSSVMRYGHGAFVTQLGHAIIPVGSA